MKNQTEATVNPDPTATPGPDGGILVSEKTDGVEVIKSGPFNRVARFR